MDLWSLIGFLVIFAGLYGVYRVSTKSKADTEAVIGKTEQEKIPNPYNGKDYRHYPPKNVEESLKEVETGQFVTLLGEPEREVKVSFTLHELTQMSSQAPWTKTGVASKGLSLGEVWIFKVPSQETGQPIWLRGTMLDTSALARFYKGTEDEPGPAKKFNLNGQTEPVAYELPGDITPGVTWEVVDIGAFKAEVDGKSDVVVNADHLFFVSSVERGGSRRLLFLDARQGYAKGSGGLFSCEVFEPPVEVTEII